MATMEAIELTPRRDSFILRGEEADKFLEMPVEEQDEFVSEHTGTNAMRAWVEIHYGRSGSLYTEIGYIYVPGT